MERYGIDKVPSPNGGQYYRVIHKPSKKVQALKTPGKPDRYRLSYGEALALKTELEAEAQRVYSGRDSYDYDPEDYM